MAPLTYLDTHVAAWLYAGRLDLFPESVRQRLEASELLVSPMVRLELQYLFEIGRAAEPSSHVVTGLATTLGLQVCTLPFDKVVSAALMQAWTRDPFDRLIVAQASIRGAPLVTRDESIRHNYRHAVWADGMGV